MYNAFEKVFFTHNDLPVPRGPKRKKLVDGGCKNRFTYIMVAH